MMRAWVYAGVSLLFASAVIAGPSWQGWRDGRSNLFLGDMETNGEAPFRQVWRTETRGEGKSSPVVSGGRVFYTSAVLEDETLLRLHSVGGLCALVGFVVLLCDALLIWNSNGISPLLHLPFILLGCPMLLADPSPVYERRKLITIALTAFLILQHRILIKRLRLGTRRKHILSILVAALQSFALAAYYINPTRHSLLQALVIYEIATVILIKMTAAGASPRRSVLAASLDELHLIFALLALSCCVICFWDPDAMWAQSLENQRWARASGPLLIVLAFGVRRLAAQGVSVKILAPACLAITIAFLFSIPQVALAPLSARSIAYLSLILPSALIATYKSGRIIAPVRLRLATPIFISIIVVAPAILFVTGLRTFAADALAYQVECLSLDDGKLIWTRKLSSLRTRLAGWGTSNATATPLIAGNLLIVAFNDITAAYDLDGNLRWKRGHSPSGRILYTQSASPIRYEDSAILLRAGERGGEEREAKSRIERIGLDDGAPIWSADLPHAHNSYGSPALFLYGDREILAIAGWERIYFIDPKSGEKLEEITVKCREVNASPTSSEPNRLFLAGGTVSGPSLMLSLSPGRPAEILWRNADVANVVSTPVVINDRIFAADMDGALMALDSATGTEVERLEIFAPVFSSLVAIGDLIYIFDSSGTGRALKHTPGLQVVATTGIEPVYATPAVASKSLVVRTENAIYRFGL